MASCQTQIKGNVVAWKKSDLIGHNVIVKDIEDISYLCNKSPKYVMFPHEMKYSEGESTVRQSVLQKILSREKLPRMRVLMTDEEVLIKIVIKILYEDIYKYFDKNYLTTDYGWKK